MQLQITDWRSDCGNYPPCLSIRNQILSIYLFIFQQKCSLESFGQRPSTVQVEFITGRRILTVSMCAVLTGTQEQIQLVKMEWNRHFQFDVLLSEKKSLHQGFSKA